MDLNDVGALNAALAFDGGRELVPFAGVHVQMMEIGPFESAYLESLDDYLGMLDGYASLGYAYTGVDEGRPYLSFGAIQLWPGVAEIWMIPDANIANVRHTFHRATKAFFDILAYELQLVRLQCTVHSRNVRADKWIRKLHFKQEGVLRAFGPEGDDYKLYARIFDVRPLFKTENTATSTGA